MYNLDGWWICTTWTDDDYVQLGQM